MAVLDVQGELSLLAKQRLRYAPQISKADCPLDLVLFDVVNLASGDRKSSILLVRTEGPILPDLISE
jgi:hypothetical protein